MLLHSHTEEQHRQPLRPAEARALSCLALQNEHLLAQGEYLAVTIISQ
jgi:hypothetical protein